MHHQNTEAIAVEMQGGPLDLAAKEATDQITSHSDAASTERYVEQPHESMSLAAMRGNWEVAGSLLRKHPNLAHVDITERGDTALHLAAIHSHTKFTRELVKWMSESDILAGNREGLTAFWYAAMSGAVDVAEIIRSKCPSVITVRGKDNVMPIYMATAIGKKHMIKYLYKLTHADYLSTSEWFWLLLALLRIKMYDLALDILLNKDRTVAMAATKDGETALHFLSQHRMSDVSPMQESIPESFSTMFAAIPCLSWLKKMFERPSMSKRAMTLAKRLWDEMQKSLGLVGAVKLIREPHPVLNLAAIAGNVELITMLTHTYPQLVYLTDSNHRTIFHEAVLERQEDVFCLIHQKGPLMELTTASVDKDDNNLLHFAAKLPPPNRLKVVSGAALQLQRELQWFKGVEKLVQSAYLEMRNKDGLTPRELFSKEHQELFKEAETWMKDTANYSMVVATLITTMAFTAVFTVPGGNQGETGLPLFLNRIWFKVFVVSNTAAMISSTASTMMFLSILIARYQKDDFLVSLPTKLMLGLATLFASIIGTLFTFTSGFFLLLDEEWMRVSRWVVVSACIALIAVFILQNIRLCVDTFRSAYWSKVMFRQGKYRLY